MRREKPVEGGRGRGVTNNVIASKYHFSLLFLSVIMLDEAHERTLYTDIVIGLMKKVSTIHVTFIPTH